MPQLIIIAFLLALIAMARLLQMDMAILFNESLTSVNGYWYCRFIPMLNAGAGLNFGLPWNRRRLLGMCLAVNFRMTHFLVSWHCCLAW